VKSIILHHPLQRKEDPLFLTGSYDKSAILWNLRTLERLFVFADFHTDYIVGVALYDPALQFVKSTASEAVRGAIQGLKLITTSYDKSIGICSLDASNKVALSVQRLGEKDGHRDGIVTVKLHIPFSSKKDALIITGGMDGLIIVWNLNKLEKMKVLLGHTDRVCAITIAHDDFLKKTFLLSGGDDGKVILWEESLYRKEMPLRDHVIQLFEHEVLFKGGKSWTMIKELESFFHEKIFLENSYLFVLAIIYNASNFLYEFWDHLALTLPIIHIDDFICNYCQQRSLLTEGDIRNNVLCNGDDLLTFAMKKDDRAAIRYILLSWTMNMNKPFEDELSEYFFHPCYYFSKESLLLLGRYPLEFTHFIMSLQLLQTFSQINSSSTTTSHNQQKPAAKHRSRSTYEVGTRNNSGYFKEEEEAMTWSAADKEVVRKSKRKGSVSLDALFQHGTIEYSNPSICDVREFYTIMNQKEDELRHTKVVYLLWIEKIIRFTSSWVSSSTSKNAANQSVLVHLYPIQNLHQIAESLIDLFLLVTEQNSLSPSSDGTGGESDLFNSEIVTLLLEHIWMKHIRTIHWFALIRYCLFLIFYSLSIYLYETYFFNDHVVGYKISRSSASSDSLKWFVYILNFWLLSSFLFFFYEEVYQFYHMRYRSQRTKDEISHEKTIRLSRAPNSYLSKQARYSVVSSKRNGPASSLRRNSVENDTILVEESISTFSWKSFFSDLFEHLTDLWNFIDVSISITGTLGFTLRIIYSTDTSLGRGILSFASIFMWFKLLYFLRPFAASGPLGKKMMSHLFDVITIT
jgi:hypothetical protein